MSFISTTRPDLASDLRAYGEDLIADRIDGLGDDQMKRIGELAARYIARGARNLSHALSLAAVEVVEGAPRELKRKRRILGKPT
jgi:hypothetical protein